MKAVSAPLQRVHAEPHPSRSGDYPVLVNEAAEVIRSS